MCGKELLVTRFLLSSASSSFLLRRELSPLGLSQPRRLVWRTFGRSISNPLLPIQHNCASNVLALAFPLRHYTDVSSLPGNSYKAFSSTEKKNMLDRENEASIVKRCKWDSDDLRERLGFKAGELFDENQLRHNYRLLVKHFHPDTSMASPQDCAIPFHKIKEAYDMLSQIIKDKKAREGDLNDDNLQSREGMTFADEARRRAQMRVLGDGIIPFLLMTLFYTYLILDHNVKRLRSYFLWHFVGIFSIIQLFPRLLAAAVLFACHSTYLIANAELKEQHAVTLLVHQDTHDLRMRLKGISDQDAVNVVIQVIVTGLKDNRTVSDKVISDNEEAQPPSKDACPVLENTVLTFDKGVLDVAIPLPHQGLSLPLKYSVKAVDQKRKFVLVDTTFRLNE